jgi:hypothetical protein
MMNWFRQALQTMKLDLNTSALFFSLFWSQFKRSKERWTCYAFRPLSNVLILIGWQSEIKPIIFYSLLISMFLWVISFFLFFPVNHGLDWIFLIIGIALFSFSMIYLKRYQLMISPEGIRYSKQIFGFTYQVQNFDLNIEILQWTKKDRTYSQWITFYDQSMHSAIAQHFFYQEKDRLFQRMGACLMIYVGHHSHICRLLKDHLYQSIQTRMRNPIALTYQPTLPRIDYWCYAIIKLFEKSLGLKRIKLPGQTLISWWAPNYNLLIHYLCFQSISIFAIGLSTNILLSLFISFALPSFCLMLFISHQHQLIVLDHQIILQKKCLGISYQEISFDTQMKQALCFDHFQTPLPNALILSHVHRFKTNKQRFFVDFNALYRIANSWNCGEIYRLLLEARLEMGHFKSDQLDLSL